MDMTNSNINNNGNKPSLHKSRSNASFSHAAVAKSDVGDFQEGYFVMAEMPHRPKQHKTPERNNQRKNEHNNHRQHNNQQRERTTKDIDLHVVQRESDSNVSNGRIHSPARSPTRNKRTSPSHSPQRHQQTYVDPSSSTVTPISPHKPRKAHSHPHIQYTERSESSLSSPSLLESGSPPKDKGPSPPLNRWAGPAFSNAPPPSSLPLPDFPPFAPQSAATAPSPSSPIVSQPISVPIMYHQASQYIQPLSPVFSPVAYAYPLHLAYEIPSQPPSLAQLSTDLRRMLNIGGQPIPA